MLPSFPAKLPGLPGLPGFPATLPGLPIPGTATVIWFNGGEHRITGKIVKRTANGVVIENFGLRFYADNNRSVFH